MNTILDLARENLAHPVAIAVVIALLIAYSLVAKKFARMPKIPVGLLILYLLMRIILNAVPGVVSDRLVHWLDVAAVIILYCAAIRIIFALTIELWFEWKRKTKIPKLTRDFVLLAIYAVITFVILRTKGGVNLAGLITTSAVLTAVIGLAAQNTLGNLFAGLALQMERPYTLGDWIRYGEHTGCVVGIGWKSTRLLTFESEMIYVPNMDIAKTVLINYSKPTKKLWMVINLGVEYGASPNKVRQVLMGVLEQEPSVIREPKPTIRVVDYGDFAITYKIRFMYDDYGNTPTLRGAIMNNIWYALRRNGIRIPFPIRDVHHRHIERRFEEDQLARERESAMAEIDSVPIFAPLPHQARGMLAQRMEIVRFGDGEEVVRQGDAGESMYILHGGAGEVIVRKSGAEPIKVADLAPPAFFGEMSLLTGEPRTATVRVKGDSTLFRIDKGLFSEVLSADSSVSVKLAEALAARQAETAEKLGQVERDRAAHVSNLTRRIKSFFGIG